jgi:hypothetical protein
VIVAAVRQALATLRLQRLRTALTLFGIGWGTASVVFLVCWGTGLRRTLEDGFQRMGRDLAVTFAGRIGEQFTPASDRRELRLTRADADALRGARTWSGRSAPSSTSSCPSGSARARSRRTCAASSRRTWRSGASRSRAGARSPRTTSTTGAA